MRVSRELNGQEVRTRVEADEQLGTLALDHFRQPVGKKRSRGDGRLSAHAREASVQLGPQQRQRAARAALWLKP
jgi:hypothetical protein